MVWQRRSDAWPAGRVSMKDGVLRACMHAVCHTRGFNACEISHAWWGVCGAWHKQGCLACKPCAKHNFLTAGMLRNCRPMCRACVSLRVRDLSRVGGVGGERQASRERFPCVSTRARSLTRTVCACFAMTRMLGMLAVCHSPHVACVRACWRCLLLAPSVLSIHRFPATWPVRLIRPRGMGRPLRQT